MAASSPSIGVASLQGTRFAALDVLRGIAILGILLANIAAFSGPEMAAMMGMAAEAHSGIDRLVEQFTIIFVNGKFRAMLGILFGIGLWLQYEKRRSVPGAWPGGYMKRTAILAGMGVMHGLFIWYGDILFLWAAIAFICCLLTGLSDLWLIRLVVIGMSLSVLVGIGIAFVMALIGGSNGLSGMGGLFDVMRPERELQIYQSGTYLEQVGHRLFFFVMNVANIIFFAPLMAPLFLLGMVMSRHEVIRRPSAHPKWRNWLLAIGFGAGLPLNAMAAFAPGNLLPFRLANELAFGGLLALGYLMLGALWAESGWLGPVQRILATVGRFALSNYLLQSLICTAVFYSWGGRLFGTVGPAWSLVVVAAVWTINIVASLLWARRFDIGPAEWLWRSLTEGRRLPWRKSVLAVETKPAFEF